MRFLSSSRETDYYLLLGSLERLEKDCFAGLGLELHGRRPLYSPSGYKRYFLSGHESILSPLPEIAPRTVEYRTQILVGGWNDPNYTGWREERTKSRSTVTLGP